MNKQKIYTKKEAIGVISQSAKLYHNNLEDKSILILAKNDKNIDTFQIDFSKTNFQHFTGTTTNLRSIDFYDAALHNNLREDDFQFKNNLLSSMKLDVLKNVVSFHQSAKMLGNYIGDRIELNADIDAGNICYVLTCRYNKRKKNILYPVGVQKEDA